MKPAELKRLIGQNLQRQRKRNGLTQERLAEVTGIAYKYIQEVEGGRANITMDTLAKLSDALEIHPKLFLQPVRKGFKN